MAAAVFTLASGDGRLNDAALHCDGNTELQAVGNASQQMVRGGLAPGTQGTASAMEDAAAASSSAASSSAASSSAASSSAEDEAAAAESAEATPMEEAAATKAEAAAATTDEEAAPEAVAAAMQEAAALEAKAAATDEATFTEAAAPAIAAASIDEAEAPEAAPATTNEAISKTAPSVARASQAVSDTDDEPQSIVQQTISNNQRAGPSSLVQLAAVESLAAASGVEVGADVERFPDLCALQVHHTSSSRVSMYSHVYMTV